MVDAVKQAERDVIAAQEALAKAIEIRDAHSLLSLDKRLAMLLHSKLCRSNHTDQCSWYYETDSVTGIHKNWGSDTTTGRYLDRAKKIIDILAEKYPNIRNMNDDDILELASIFISWQ